MSENSFVFSIHADRNSNRQKALNVAIALRHSHISFNQIEFTLNSLRLSIDRNEYYNLQRSDAMTSEDRLRCVLHELKVTDFHVRCHES